MGVALNLAAHAILILVQRALIGSGEMAVIEARIETFIGAHHAILAMQAGSLAAGDLAFGKVVVDPPVLMGQPVIDFDPAGMMLGPGRG
jgi:hypothetical protein